MEYTKGQIIFSKCGRDKGRAFVVVDVIGEYLYICDGVTRPLTKPNKKKAKHIQKTNTIVLEEKFVKSNMLLDKDVEKALKEYLTNSLNS